MCIMLYIGTTKHIPRIPWDVNSPSFNTSDISEDEKNIILHFSLPYITYIGSEEGCGCGFRHALLEGKQWIPVVSTEDAGIMQSELQNHSYLFDFLNNNLYDEDIIEIYGCWDGDFQRK